MRDVIFAIAGCIFGVGLGAQLVQKQARSEAEVALQEELDAFKQSYRRLHNEQKVTRARELTQESKEVKVSKHKETAEIAESEGYSPPAEEVIEVRPSGEGIDYFNEGEDMPDDPRIAETAELIYYAADEVLANTYDEVVDNIEYLVGDLLDHIRVGESMWARNYTVGCDYLVSSIDVSYAEYVLGYDTEPGES